MMRTTLALVLLAACGTDSHPVELCANGEALAVYREGTGAWKTLTATSKGRYELPVSGDYEVVTVTTYPGGTFFTNYIASTAGETKPIDQCGEQRAMMPADVTGTVTGTAGMVFMDGAGQSPSGGTFSLGVTPGTTICS